MFSLSISQNRGTERKQSGMFMKIYYSPKLKHLARQLRKSATIGEAILWRYLKKRQILGYDFHRQKPIGEYIVDFYCPQLKLVIEIDGYSHNFRTPSDEEKEKFLAKLGVKLLRFLEKDVRYNTESVISVIKSWIEKNEYTPL